MGRRRATGGGVEDEAAVLDEFTDSDSSDDYFFDDDEGGVSVPGETSVSLSGNADLVPAAVHSDSGSGGATFDGTMSSRDQADAVPQSQRGGQAYP